MKLELKHLAPYLPFELKLFRPNAISKNIPFYELTVSTMNDCIKATNNMVENNIFKPMLKPISLNVLNDFEIPLSDIDILQYMISGDTETYKWLSYRTIEFLFSNHYDVFGLIKNKLAIDINTL